MEAQSRSDLLYGGSIANGIDALVGALHPQELVCDDGAEVRLAPRWQPLLQLQHRRMLKGLCSTLIRRSA